MSTQHAPNATDTIRARRSLLTEFQHATLFATPGLLRRDYHEDLFQPPGVTGDSVMIAPVLSGDALAAVRHRGSHLQIIASAGSGKTEVVAQRFAKLMAMVRIWQASPHSPSLSGPCES